MNNSLNSISLIDLDLIVPNEYLLRNDKIFMNEGVEVRVPLLDLNIINNLLNINEFKKFQYSFKSKGLIKKFFKMIFINLLGENGGCNLLMQNG